MVLVFLVLSISLCIITRNVWCTQNYMELKSNLIVATLGFTAFNAILALLLLFNALESNPENLIRELIQHPAALSTLILCLANGVFYSVFTVLFLTSSSQPNKRT
jgi:uncharacterized membrane protein